MNPADQSMVLAAWLFFGLVACLEVGYRIGRRALGTSDQVPEGGGAIEAAVFALLGLLLGFSFAGGASRLDTRRELIVREANAIGTAYLRVDMLPEDAQPQLRRAFREYLDIRLQVYEKLNLPGPDAAEREMEKAAILQRSIWSLAVIATRGESQVQQTAARLLLPAVNDMIDLTTARTVALFTRLPQLILGMLVSVALLSALLAGYAMAKRRRRSWFHGLVYALSVAVTVYAVLALDNPRAGFVGLDMAENALTQLRDSIQEVR
jgi:hypothetical protein